MAKPRGATAPFPGVGARCWLSRALVEPLRDGFREGLDTGILRDARALLQSS